MRANEAAGQGTFAGLRPAGVPADAVWDGQRWLLRPSAAAVPSADGMWTIWEADGTLAERAEYVAGRRHGPAWCRVTPGTFTCPHIVAARGRFENDCPRGRWVLLDVCGRAVSELHYGKGEPLGRA